LSDAYAIILAGGSGTRFWPASRKALPKQLLPLGSSGDLTLIAETVRRILPIVPRERILIATGADLVEASRRTLPELPASAFLGEPLPRNTAPCIAWAASIVARRDPEAVAMVLPSDHRIADEASFLRIVETALDSARAGAITTIGIEATRPDTGYGYIELGDPVSRESPSGDFAASLRRAKRFVEKPNAALAKEYIESGRHVWNGGMFFFRAQQMLDEIARHLPELGAGIARIEAAAREGSDRERVVTKEVFSSLASVSIDVGLMEKLEVIHVVPGSFGWSDLGSWESAWDLAEKDQEGNATNARIVTVDARNNLLLDLRREKKGLMAIVGLHDMCVVQTDDALLVIPRSRSQDVRAIVAELERRGERDEL
jgi:mannose-1-phosphate guanylyltransferase